MRKDERKTESNAKVVAVATAANQKACEAKRSSRWSIARPAGHCYCCCGYRNYSGKTLKSSLANLRASKWKHPVVWRKMGS